MNPAPPRIASGEIQPRPSSPGELGADPTHSRRLRRFARLSTLLSKTARFQGSAVAKPHSLWANRSKRAPMPIPWSRAAAAPATRTGCCPRPFANTDADADSHANAHADAHADADAHAHSHAYSDAYPVPHTDAHADPYPRPTPKPKPTPTPTPTPDPPPKPASKPPAARLPNYRNEVPIYLAMPEVLGRSAFSASARSHRAASGRREDSAPIPFRPIFPRALCI
jgi:hypothetical protein